MPVHFIVSFVHHIVSFVLQLWPRISAILDEVVRVVGWMQALGYLYQRWGNFSRRFTEIFTAQTGQTQTEPHAISPP